MLTSKVQLGYVLTSGGGGGKLSRAVYLAPGPEFQRELIIPKFLLHHLLFKGKGYKHYFNQTEMLTSKVQLGYKN